MIVSFLSDSKVLKRRKPKNLEGYLIYGYDDYEEIGYCKDYIIVEELPNKKYVWIEDYCAEGYGHDIWLCSNSYKYIDRDAIEVLEELGYDTKGIMVYG